MVYIGVSEGTVCQRQCKESYVDSYLSTGKEKKTRDNLSSFWHFIGNDLARLLASSLCQFQSYKCCKLYYSIFGLWIKVKRHNML